MLQEMTEMCGFMWLVVDLDQCGFLASCVSGFWKRVESWAALKIYIHFLIHEIVCGYHFFLINISEGNCFIIFFLTKKLPKKKISSETSLMFLLGHYSVTCIQFVTLNLGCRGVTGRNFRQV